MAISKISLFVNTLAGGGAERVMINLARALANRGLAIDLVVMRAIGEYVDEVPSSIRLVDLKAHRAIASLPRLIRYLKRERPKILISNLDAANVIALLARRLSFVRTNIIVSVACSLRDPTWRVNWRSRLLPIIIQWSYPWAQAVLTKSEGVKKDVIESLKLPKDKVHVVPNPVITPEFYEKANEPLKHPWFTPGQPPVILGVGRLDWTKNFSSLVRAFAHLRQKMDIRLLILGEGVDRPKLETMVEVFDIKNDVLLPGFVGNPFKYMMKAKVFVLPSKEEGFGLVLVEALACGCPVVSTCCDGPVEILQDGRWGRLVPEGDHNALAQAIEDAISDSGDKGFSRAKDYTLDRTADEYLRILQDVCDI